MLASSGTVSEVRESDAVSENRSERVMTGESVFSLVSACLSPVLASPPSSGVLSVASLAGTSFTSVFCSILSAIALLCTGSVLASDSFAESADSFFWAESSSSLSEMPKSCRIGFSFSWRLISSRSTGSFDFFSSSSLVNLSRSSSSQIGEKEQTIVNIVIHVGSIVVFIRNELGLLLVVACLVVRRNALPRWKKIEFVQDKGTLFTESVIQDMSFPIPMDSIILPPSALGMAASSSFDRLNGMCTTRDGSSTPHFRKETPTEIPVVVTVGIGLIRIFGL